MHRHRDAQNESLGGGVAATRCWQQSQNHQLIICRPACSRTDAQSPAGRVTVGVKSSPRAKDAKVDDSGAAVPPRVPRE